MSRVKSPVFDFQLADGRIMPCAFELSARARRVLLKYSPERGLRMAWPRARKPDPYEIGKILEQLRPWIEKQAARAQKRAEENSGDGLRGPDDSNGARGPDSANGQRGPGGKNEMINLPDSINLAAVGEMWQVFYTAAETKRTTLEVRGASPGPAGKPRALTEAPRTGPDATAYGTRGGSLHINGPAPQLYSQILQQWLLDRAKCHLPAETFRLAARLGFKINKVTVKRQKTRWGSCSVRGNINLNYRLMLLPPELARFVIVHEFCHLKHMNHGEAFHALLAGFYPNQDELDKELRRAGRALPAWSAL